MLAAFLLAGCASAQHGERVAREQEAQVGRQLAPGATRTALPQPRAGSSLAEFARYAELNHPAVFASYQDWRASVEAIAPSRALPDPQFVFEADVSSTLLQFLPGLMFNFMTAAKRGAMAREATAASQISYRTYVSAVLDVASDVRKSWIELAYLDAAVRLREESLAALDQASGLADADYATGRGAATLETQVRLENEKARSRSDVAMLNHRLKAAQSSFKSSLGLLPADPDPAWPHPELVATALPAEDELWRRIQASNPSLARMRAMVDMAMSNVEVARAAGTPDFSLGAMTDLKASPVIIRPLASVSLPIWRSKIAAVISAAEARRDAAAARVDAEQLSMAARLAQLLHMIHESDQMIAYVDGAALPNYERTIATVEAGYQSGMASMATIPETRLMSLGVRLDRAAALRDRENAVTDLLLMIAELAPAGSPLIAERSTAQP